MCSKLSLALVCWAGFAWVQLSRCVFSGWQKKRKQNTERERERKKCSRTNLVQRKVLQKKNKTATEENEWRKIENDEKSTYFSIKIKVFSRCNPFICSNTLLLCCFVFYCFADKLVRISVALRPLQRSLSHPLSPLIDINRVRVVAIIFATIRWNGLLLVFFSPSRQRATKSNHIITVIRVG